MVGVFRCHNKNTRSSEMPIKPDVHERREFSSCGLDAEELAWWQRFSDVEEQFCWVQTPAIRRFLLGKYIKEIVRTIPQRGTVLEFGCGTGWLCQLLAEFGAVHVCGVDFSGAQIQRAQESYGREGTRQNVEFHRLNGSLADLTKVLPMACFD